MVFEDFKEENKLSDKIFKRMEEKKEKELLIVDPSFLKQRIRKEKAEKERQRKVRKRLIKESEHGTGDSVSMFELSLKHEYNNLSQDVRDQIKKDYEKAKINKQQYTSHLKQEELKKSLKASTNDLIPVPVVTQIMRKIVTHLNEHENNYDFENHFNCFRIQKFEKREEEMVELRNTLKSCKCDMKTISKYVRKIPVISQILKSSFLRVELIEQFWRWVGKRQELIKEKLTWSAEEKFISKTDQTLNQTASQEPEEARSSYDRFEEKLKIPLEHHQRIKFGGILKNFMDVWEAEEIFLTSILVLYWQTGNIRIQKEEDNLIFIVRYVDQTVTDLVDEVVEDQSGKDTSSQIKESKKQFVEKMVKDSKEADCTWEPKIIEKLAEFVFEVIFEVGKEKSIRRKGLGGYTKIDPEKEEKMGLKAFVEGISFLEDLCDGFSSTQVFEKLGVEDTKDDFRFVIKQEALQMLIIAENAEYSDLNQSDISTRSQTCEKLRTFEEIEELHLLLWFISNLSLCDGKYQQEKELNKLKRGEMQSLHKKIETFKKSNQSLFQPDQVIPENRNKQKQSDPSRSSIQDDAKLDKNSMNEHFEKLNERKNTYSNVSVVPDYIPLVQIMNHFYFSVTDNIFLRQVSKNTESYEELFQRFIFDCTKEEIIFELTFLFCLMEKSQRLEKKKFFGDKIVFFEKLNKGLTELHKEIFDSKDRDQPHLIKNEIYHWGIKELPQAFDEQLRDLVEKFLEGKLSSLLEKIIADALLSEIYIDVVRLADPSPLTEKTSHLISITKEKIEQDAESRVRLRFPQPLQPFWEVMPKQGISQLEIPELSFVSANKKNELERLFESKDSCEFYLKILKNMKESSTQVICQSNAQRSWRTLISRVRQKIQEMTIEGLNDKVDPSLQIVYNTKGKRYEFCKKELKQQWRYIRRFFPEFKEKDRDMMVPKRIWDRLWRFIKQAYWKVQIGVITWFALLVDGAPYESDVIDLLIQCKFWRVHRRQTAIKVMGIFAEHFKLFRRELVALKQTKIPWWVFVGSDCIFGYTDTDKEEHKDWQQMVLKNVTNWIFKKKEENYADYSLGYDLEMCTEHFLRDFRIAVTKEFLVTYQEEDHYLTVPSKRLTSRQGFSQKFNQFKNNQVQSYKERDKSRLIYKEKEPYVVLQQFFGWCKAFLKFSVSGSAYGLKISRREIPEVEDLTPEQDLAQIEFGEYYDLYDLYDYGLLPEEIPEVVNKQSISKTVAFALGGKSLSRIFFWAGGKSDAQFGLHLKKEPKKIRNVANSDLVSFVRKCVDSENNFVGETNLSLSMDRESTPRNTQKQNLHTGSSQR